MGHARGSVRELKFNPPCMSGNYLSPWVIRAYMLDIMEQKGIARLKVDEDRGVIPLRMKMKRHAKLGGPVDRCLVFRCSGMETSFVRK